MIIDYTKNTYDTVSLRLIVNLYDTLLQRGYSFNKLNIEIQVNQQRQYLKLESNLGEFITFAKNFINTSNVVGDSVVLIKNLEVTVDNISNEFITWNADFYVEILQDFTLKISEGKKQDNLRQEGIDIHVDRYKFFLLEELNKYAGEIQSLIRQKELTAVDLNVSRYVDPFYVADQDGVDNSYVFP